MSEMNRRLPNANPRHMVRQPNGLHVRVGITNNECVRAIRFEYGRKIGMNVTQHEFAYILTMYLPDTYAKPIWPATVSNWETGRFTVSDELLADIAKAVKMRLSSLFPKKAAA